MLSVQITAFLALNFWKWNAAYGKEKACICHLHVPVFRNTTAHDSSNFVSSRHERQQKQDI
jgi:hypothetical protein